MNVALLRLSAERALGYRRWTLGGEKYISVNAPCGCRCYPKQDGFWIRYFLSKHDRFCGHNLLTRRVEARRLVMNIVGRWT